MKKLIFAVSLILLSALALKVQSQQQTASYGVLVSSLSTALTTAVAGTSYAVPAGSAVIITWTVVADGSALSATLEGSNDNTTWFTVDTQTTAAGGIKNYGFTSIRFVRVSAVSRTGGTATNGTIVIGRAFPTTTVVSGSGNISSGTFTAGDGTALLPAYSFASEPTLGFWRSSAGNITLQGALNATSAISATNFNATSGGSYGFSASGYLSAPANGVFTLRNAAVTIGAEFKVDALPTIASGFGTSPSVTAGSTPFAGSVNVGTGGAVATGTINFNGTAFPSAPFCVASTTLQAAAAVRAFANTTSLSLTSAANFPSGEVISYICVSSK